VSGILIKRVFLKPEIGIDFITSSKFEKSLYNPNREYRNHPMKREVTR
jgi:hypothetical protein